MLAWAGTLVPLSAATAPVFGPEIFARDAGSPRTVTRSFTVGAASAPFVVELENGVLREDEGEAGFLVPVSSALIRIDGETIFGPSDFNRTVARLEREVSLTGDTDHTLTVELRSAPGSGIRLTLFGEVPDQPPAVNITVPPPDLVTAEREIEITGTFEGFVESVEVNGFAAILEDGTFTVPAFSLPEGTTRLLATASNGAGTATDVVTVRRDTAPPRVVIEIPAPGSRLVSDTVTVAGTVNDILPGATVSADDVAVTVNGRPALVANRGFLFEDLPLELGENRIEAVATDRAGNTERTEITVTREPDLVGLRLEIAGGNAQRALVGSRLPEPLSVRVTDREGEPVPDRIVELEVHRGDGFLHDPAGDPRRRLRRRTDVEGEVSVPFTLGSRTGEGFHRVRVTTPGSLTFVELCATALPAAPATISVVKALPPRGAVGQALSEPLQVLVADATGNGVPGVPVTFRVEGGGGLFKAADGSSADARTRAVLTDADGIARVRWVLGTETGRDRQRASATFEGNPGFPATFLVTAVTPGAPEATTITGVVQDRLGQPIEGVRAVVRGAEGPEGGPLEAFTGSDGRFVIDNVPPGGHRVGIEGSTADDPARNLFYPSLDMAIEALPGVTNELRQPVILPFLDLEGAKLVGGDEDVVLEMAGVPGFALKVFAHSTVLPDGTRAPVVMSSSQVSFNRVPMPPPQGATPLMVGTLQPAGVRFDPPAQVIYPNFEGLAPGDVADIFAFHHDIGEFVNMGPGTVSEDGSVVVSDPGFGLTRSGWHCLIRMPGPAAKCSNDCEVRVEWHYLDNGDPAAGTRTDLPVLLRLDSPQEKARVLATFSPAGGSFDAEDWLGGPPPVSKTDETTSGSTARVTLVAQEPGKVTIRSPTYRVPVDGTDKTCETDVDVVVLDIRLKEVEFSGSAFHEVLEDNGTPYGGPHWQDNSSPLDGDANDPGDRKFPVSYVRGSSSRLTARFLVAEPDLVDGPWLVRGQGSDGIRVPESEAEVSTDSIQISEVPASGAFPNTVAFLNTLDIEWEVSPDGGETWFEVATSKNRVYVTLARPVATNLFETLLDIAARNADGLAEPDSVVAAIWSDFQGPIPGVRRKEVDGHNRVDGVEMKYWNPVTDTCQTLEEMLVRLDGNGSCVAWSKLFHETLDSIGVEGSKIHDIHPDLDLLPSANGLLIKNWKFGSHVSAGGNGICESDPLGDDVALNIQASVPNGPCIAPGANTELESNVEGDDKKLEGLSGNDVFPFLVFSLQLGEIVFGSPAGDLFNRPGQPGQGSPEPRPFFNIHFVVRYGGKIYDPSYGLGPFSTELAHENAILDGLRSSAEDDFLTAFGKRNSEQQPEIVYTRRMDLE